MNSSNVVMMPYKMTSQSARNLATSLSSQLRATVRRLYTDERGTFVPKSHHRVINWGCSAAPDRFRNAVFVNKPANVAVASNKLTTFECFREAGSINIPEFTTSRDEAVAWINEGRTVVSRTKLNGHSGAGIVLAAREEDLPNCPLYVQYIKKAKEFRVHVAFGKVIDIQAKRKRSDYEGDVDYAIRNHHTGWVYCRENIEEPADMREQAVRAILALGLDFGAVDIIYNQHRNTCYVLEVNTAPGCEGTTVEKYVQAFKEWVDENR